MTPAPDLIEPVIGFRMWRVDGSRLHSQAAGTRWSDPTLTAVCPATDSESHLPPGPRCECGIYAYHRAGDLKFTPSDQVCGVVSLWGRIEVHADGMRAEHARIEALAPPPHADGRLKDRLARIADRYGVDFVARRQLRRVATRFGTPVPAELYPQRPTFVPPPGRPHFRFRIKGDNWRVWPWGWWSGHEELKGAIGDIYVLDQERVRAVFAHVAPRSRAKAERLLHRWARGDGSILEVAEELHPLAQSSAKHSGFVVACLGCGCTVGLSWKTGIVFTHRRYMPTVCHVCGSRLLGTWKG